jgi:hypothetical protein
MFFFPKSPRWLASKDRWEEAIKVLANLHGGGDMNHPKVLAQYQEIEEALTQEREAAKSDWVALTEPRMLKRVVLGMSVQMWSQLCGINVMIYYIVYIMEAAGLGDPLLTASIQYILNVSLTLPAILYLDKWGRRPSLLLGSLSMMTLLFITGALLAVYGEPFQTAEGPLAAISWVLRDNQDASRAVVACSYLFICAFAVTWVSGSRSHTLQVLLLTLARVLSHGLTLLKSSHLKFVPRQCLWPPLQTYVAGSNRPAPSPPPLPSSRAPPSLYVMLIIP